MPPPIASLTLAELVRLCVPAPEEPATTAGGDGPGSPAPVVHEDLQDVPAELSRALAELARTPEVAVDAAARWVSPVNPGDVVAARFELRRELGRGGFGVVFEALDRELGREVAFKAVLPGHGAARHDAVWIQREARAVASLDHPGIATLHALGAAPTGPYLVFELLRGETLERRLRRGGALPLRDAVEVASRIARVLDHAHRVGVVHRDLKPGNVFLCEGGAVKVLDFGLAHLFGRGGACSGGAPAYIAPEQWRSAPGDARTDLFALGVLLHEMVWGTLPDRALSPGEGQAATRPDPWAPASPERLRRLVGRMLRRDPSERPQSAAEVAAELDRVRAADPLGDAIARLLGWR
jgi:serine/threonine protein kinase